MKKILICFIALTSLAAFAEVVPNGNTGNSVIITGDDAQLFNEALSNVPVVEIRGKKMRVITLGESNKQQVKLGCAVAQDTNGRDNDLLCMIDLDSKF
jgi:hypothetical protein